MKRQTARKCRINHLVKGNFIQREGWEPSYFETELGQISRANVMAIVVSKEGGSLLVDDGTNKIVVRSFGEPLEFEIGDPVTIIGRPRVYNNEPYIAAEIVKKVDARWMDYHKKEISSIPVVAVEKPEPIQKTSNLTGEDVLEHVRKLDDGSGAQVEDVCKSSEEAEKILNSLMEQGEVFEIKPGRVKVLE